ncbi:MAG: IS4 family transposase [Muribaculaceae bacterium]|nr:IS4 family transposase [Muribaculaceae bacterium]
MYNVKYVFAQLIAFLNRSKLNRIVTKYEGDRYVKHFTCWNQLLAMMFGQLCNRASLRDLITILEAHSSKCYHLGLGKNISKTNLAYANQNRDCRIFEEFAYYMIAEAREKRKTKIFDIGGNVYAFDSTTIDLCLAVFWWAKFRKRKGGIKVHTLYDIETQIPTFFHITTASVIDVKAMDVITYEQGSYYVFDRGYNDFKRLYKINTIEAYFVVRAKKNLQFKPIKWKRRLPKNVRSDATVELTGFYPGKYYPDNLRLVRFWDEDQAREFTFLTNNFSLTSLQVANLYKNRWQIELFFKWLKQHLKIKKFWGTSENAVKIQIYCAICAYCLVAILQHDMRLDRSTYEVLQILGVSLTDSTHLQDLFDKTKSQNFNVLTDRNGPNLFDF